MRACVCVSVCVCVCVWIYCMCVRQRQASTGTTHSRHDTHSHLPRTFLFLELGALAAFFSFPLAGSWLVVLVIVVHVASRATLACPGRTLCVTLVGKARSPKVVAQARDCPGVQLGRVRACVSCFCVCTRARVCVCVCVCVCLFL
jgi:hypothetical protein